jgi:hypothetical protein
LFLGLPLTPLLRLQANYTFGEHRVWNLCENIDDASFSETLVYATNFHPFYLRNEQFLRIKAHLNFPFGCDNVMHVVVRNYREEDREYCRSLWRELTEWHREIYQDSRIGGEHPEEYFDKYLANGWTKQTVGCRTRF